MSAFNTIRTADISFSIRLWAQNAMDIKVEIQCGISNVAFITLGASIVFF